jgi:uncharacterized small protein (DUF1192 family)
MEAKPMITRYAMSWGKDEDGSIYVSPTEQPKGNWVKYEDYARLLCESVHDLNQIGGLQQENARLKTEVERLRKAGDAMFEALNLNDDVFDNQDKRKAQANWNAANEGKPNDHAL